jgi:hypothetical protein
VGDGCSQHREKANSFCLKYPLKELSFPRCCAIARDFLGEWRSKRLKMRQLSDHADPEAKPNGPRAKTKGRATKHPLRSKNAKPPHQTAKFLKLPATSHTAVVADVAAIADTEA